MHVFLGLTQMDEVQGAQAKWNELYEQYYENILCRATKKMTNFSYELAN